MSEAPEIVCLCGSLRFAAELRALAWELTTQGVIVLAPVEPPTAEAVPSLTQEQRHALGVLHLRRIELADRVVVVNPGGYVGSAVEREVAHAHALGVPVRFTDPG